MDDTMDKRDPGRHGLLQPAIDGFLEGTRALAGLVGTAGTGALDAMPGTVQSTVTRMLSSLQQLAELAAFDHQLDVLERSMAPLQTWSHQWNRMRQSLTENLHVTGTPGAH